MRPEFAIRNKYGFLVQAIFEFNAQTLHGDGRALVEIPDDLGVYFGHAVGVVAGAGGAPVGDLLQTVGCGHAFDCSYNVGETNFDVRDDGHVDRPRTRKPCRVASHRDGNGVRHAPFAELTADVEVNVDGAGEAPAGEECTDELRVAGRIWPGPVADRTGDGGHGNAQQGGKFDHLRFRLAKRDFVPSGDERVARLDQQLGNSFDIVLVGTDASSAR